MNQSKVLLASRLPIYNLAQQKQPLYHDSERQKYNQVSNISPNINPQILEERKKWQLRLIRQMNAVFNTCFPLLINDLEIIDLRGLLPLRREKGTEARIEKQHYIIGQPCYMIWCYQSLRGSYLP